MPLGHAVECPSVVWGLQIIFTECVAPRPALRLLRCPLEYLSAHPVLGSSSSNSPRRGDIRRGLRLGSAVGAISLSGKAEGRTGGSKLSAPSSDPGQRG